MEQFKINKTGNHIVMSNLHLKDDKLSLKAKGLLTLMLSLPDNWDYSIKGLVSICIENDTSIKSALKELKEYGYLEVIKLLPNETKSGKYEYIYNIYESPYKKEPTIFDYYEESFGRLISSIEYEEIDILTNEFNEDIVKYAIHIAVENNKRTLSYVKGILRNWKSNGYKTLKEIKDNELKKNENHDNIELFDYDWLNEGDEE